MQSKMTIGDLSRRNVVCIGEDLSLKEAANLMRSKHVGSVVVIRHAELGPIVTGILTDRDIAIVGVARDFDPQTLRVADVMTPEPVTAHPEDSILSVLQLMKSHGVRRVPLTTLDGMLVGIVTFDDVLQAIAEDMQMLAQAIAGERKQESRLKV
ncbi:CBS domain-containing protein [Noviherbaspirillum malthae]|uniref:CBS domain-containing protein n=1 Tax=Noviherbaspirillum malthae TaxID=1260987 RepID=UPI00188F466E|nr:CBS domain-containing protein [Noviherbaspirillum malthae]